MPRVVEKPQPKESGNPWRQLPPDLRRRVKADAMTRDEYIWQWLERACEAALKEAKK